MTTPAKRVLIVGRSPQVLDTTLKLLGERGYDAHATRDFEGVADRFDAAALDIVVFGGQVAPHQKAEMRDALLAANPRLAFLQGLSGIPGLIVDQIEASGTAGVPIPGQAPVYAAERRAIELVLFAPLEVKVTVYWITELVPPDPKSESAVLVDGTLASGDHRFRLPDAVKLDAAFATVLAGGAAWSFRLSA